MTNSTEEQLTNIERMRDEVRLKAHLGSQEFKEKLSQAESRLFEEKERIREALQRGKSATSERVDQALETLRQRFETLQKELRRS